LEFILLLLLSNLENEIDTERETTTAQQQRSICQSVVVGAIGTRRCIFNRLLLFLVASLFVHFAFGIGIIKKCSQRERNKGKEGTTTTTLLGILIEMN
jgi:hypothetical protein